MKTRFFNLPALVVSISLLALSGTLKLAISAHPLSALAPTVTSVSPNQGYNYQSTTITITGGDFVATPTAQLNNVPLINITFVDSAMLTATVPADLLSGAYTLTVTNPDSQSANLPSAFTVLQSSDGSLVPWKIMAAMTKNRDGLAAVAINGYIYALGGQSPASPPYENSVERTTINADGSLGPWQAVSAMITPRAYFAAVATDSYLYAIGGAEGSIGPGQTALASVVSVQEMVNRAKIGRGT